jgi:phosphotriesterase-related protein
MTTVQTVLGPKDTGQLGVTLMHEHLLLDARRSWQEPKEANQITIAHSPVTPDILHVLRQHPFINLDNCALFNEDDAVNEAKRFHLFGGNTIVDATCRGIGRDPRALQRIARRTELNIIMGTGFYLERTHPIFVQDATVQQLTDVMVSDLIEGDDETGIRAGYIGEIGISHMMTLQEEKVLRAAARAQSETGVALSIHLPGWERLGHQVLDLVEGEGGDLTKTILDHMNPSHEDVGYQTSLADRGAYLEYDMIGLDYYFPDQDAQSPSDEENAKAIRRLIDKGYMERLLLSQDVFLKMMLTCYGGNGYAYINQHFIPRLRRHGVSEAAVHTIMVVNPARALGLVS